MNIYKSGLLKYAVPIFVCVQHWSVPLIILFYFLEGGIMLFVCLFVCVGLAFFLFIYLFIYFVYFLS